MFLPKKILQQKCLFSPFRILQNLPRTKFCSTDKNSPQKNPPTEQSLDTDFSLQKQIQKNPEVLTDFRKYTQKVFLSVGFGIITISAIPLGLDLYIPGQFLLIGPSVATLSYYLIQKKKIQAEKEQEETQYLTKSNPNFIKKLSFIGFSTGIGLSFAPISWIFDFTPDLLEHAIALAASTSFAGILATQFIKNTNYFALKCFITGLLFNGLILSGLSQIPEQWFANIFTVLYNPFDIQSIRTLVYFLVFQGFMYFDAHNATKYYVQTNQDYLDCAIRHFIKFFGFLQKFFKKVLRI